MLVLKHTSSVLIITRSLVQKPACKDPERNAQSAVITFRPTYTPVLNAPARAQFTTGGRKCQIQLVKSRK
ncbi:hypothetical protein EFP44_00085 [Lacticaseibacillus paracasei]|nr:hypothetical protein [Lacticaseibacillus paracasei]